MNDEEKKANDAQIDREARDRFAAAALTGLLAAVPKWETLEDLDNLVRVVAPVGQYAYAIASNMMLDRTAADNGVVEKRRRDENKARREAKARGVELD